MPIVRLMTASAVLAVGLIAGATLHEVGLGTRTALAQGTPAQAPAAPKFAYVRGQDILAQTPGRQELEQQFQKEVDSARAQEKVWGDSINALLGDYASKEATLSADARTARQAQIREKQAQFQQRQQQLEQQVQQDNQRLVAPILQRVNNILDQIRNENSYTFIFDVQAQGGAIVAADKNLDITDQVVARLRAMGPVTPSTGTATTPPPKGPTSTPSGLGRPRNPQ
jgi:outer membrane protein